MPAPMNSERAVDDLERLGARARRRAAGSRTSPSSSKIVTVAAAAMRGSRSVGGDAEVARDRRRDRVLRAQHQSGARRRAGASSAWTIRRRIRSAPRRGRPARRASSRSSRAARPRRSPPAGARAGAGRGSGRPPRCPGRRGPPCAGSSRRPCEATRRRPRRSAAIGVSWKPWRSNSSSAARAIVVLVRRRLRSRRPGASSLIAISRAYAIIAVVANLQWLQRSARLPRRSSILAREI